MNKRKSANGITLIALIITIIVLVILAVVAINAVTGDSIITLTQNAKKEHLIAQEKEEIALAQNEWAIQKHYPDKGGYTFKSFFMESKLVTTGIAKSVEGNDDGPLTIEMESGRKYTVTDNGEITGPMGSDDIPVPYSFKLSDFSDVLIYSNMSSGGITGGAFLIPKTTFIERIGIDNETLNTYGVEVESGGNLKLLKALTCEGTDSGNSGDMFDFFHSLLNFNTAKNKLFTFINTFEKGGSKYVCLATTYKDLTTGAVIIKDGTENDNFEEYDELLFVFPETDSRASITINLENITSSNTELKVVRETSYTTILSPVENYILPNSVEIKMGEEILVEGTDYTYNSINGELIINNVKGNIEINGVGVDNSVSVTYNLTNIETDNNNSKIVKNVEYTATLRVTKQEYVLPIEIEVVVGENVIVEGTDYTYNASTGELTINANCISDNIEITAIAKGKEEFELETYLFGQDLKGRQFSDIFDSSIYAFKQDTNNSENSIYEKIKYADSASNKYYIRYNRDIYTFNIESDLTVGGSLQKYKTPEGNLGKYVMYKNIKWIVLNEQQDYIELISADSLGSLLLGNRNSFDESRKSYNDAVSLMVAECKEQTGIQTNIRNVGGPETEDALSANNTVIFDDLTYFEKEEGKSFSDYEGAVKGIRKEDFEYKIDFNLMKDIGIAHPDNYEDYWLSSRIMYEQKTAVYFMVNSVRKGSEKLRSFTNESLIYIDYRVWTYKIAMPVAKKVRPIIKLDATQYSSIIQSSKGTIDQPIDIN